MIFMSNDGESNNLAQKVRDFINYVGPWSWDNWKLPYKISGYKVKNVKQEDFIEYYQIRIKTRLLAILQNAEIENINSMLIDALEQWIREFEKDLEVFKEAKYADRLINILEIRNICIYSALINAHSPKEISQFYNDQRGKHPDKNRDKIMEWDVFFRKRYGKFYKEIMQLMPKGKHAEFHTKRNTPKSKQTTNTTEVANNNRLLDKAKEASDHKKQAAKKASIESNRKKDKLLQEAKLSAKEKKPKFPNGQPNAGIRSNENQPNSVDLSDNSEIPASKNTESNLGNNTSTGNIEQLQEIESESAINSSMEAELKEVVVADSKPAQRPTIKPDLNLKPRTIADADFEPKKESKPKKNLLEMAKIMAEEKKDSTAKKGKDISYPVVFTKRQWRVFWSNDKRTKGSPWGNDFFWNCGSIGKKYLMNLKSRDNLTRECDVNQDFVVVNSTRREKLRVLMFDGVSQSRAPRQWAECLAKTYSNKGMKVDILRNHSKKIENWHNTSVKEWNDWIEKEYMPRRTHLPSWRLKNEVTSSFTTFISIEISPEKTQIANIGDSAVFCRLKTGELKYLPSTYNHLLGPKNISTRGLYNMDEMEFCSFRTKEIDSILACTDAIADYIFDDDLDKMGDKFQYCISRLSSGGDKFEFISEMIAKGPANGGWLEDDVSFFSFVRNSNLDSENTVNDSKKVGEEE